MSEEQSQDNGTANGDVPEIELIIKVGINYEDAFSITTFLCFQTLRTTTVLPQYTKPLYIYLNILYLYIIAALLPTEH